MAYEEITSPIALDESFNTTENTSRNIADVLADELSNLADAVKPDAGDIALDTISGMSANNVQDGIEELKQSLATYSYYDFAPKVQVQRYGHVVTLSIGAWYNFADLVIPAEYRPNTQIYTVAEQRDGNNTNLGFERITINTDGTVQPNYAGVSFMGLFTWIID